MLDIADQSARVVFHIHVVRPRGSALGRAGRWLVADLKTRLMEEA